MRTLRPIVMTGAVAAALSCLTLCPRRADAQILETPRPRQGYYFSVGMLQGAMRVTEKDEPARTLTAGGFRLRMGELLTRRFGLGLLVGGGSLRGDHQEGTTFDLALEAQWELHERLALRGGMGLGVVSLKDTTVPDAKLRGGLGTGYALGLSYDWFPWKRVTGGWALTPVAQFRFTPADNLKAFIGMLGVEVTNWTGRPRNQLELPDAEAYQAR